MNFNVAPEFEKALKKLGKKYHSLKYDYLAFLSELEKNPMMGDELFPNCRKARMAISSKGKGKSGDGRIIFYFEVEDDKITLLYIYDKSDMENVQTAFIEQILKSLYHERKKSGSPGQDGPDKLSHPKAPSSPHVSSHCWRVPHFPNSSRFHL